MLGEGSLRLYRYNNEQTVQHHLILDKQTTTLSCAPVIESVHGKRQRRQRQRSQAAKEKASPNTNANTASEENRDNPSLVITMQGAKLGSESSHRSSNHRYRFYDIVLVTNYEHRKAY